MGSIAGNRSTRSLAVLGIVATTALWGASYPMIKQLMDTFPPCTLGVLRLAIAISVLLPVLVASGCRPQFGRASILMGITGVAAFQLFQNAGMADMPAGPAAIVLFGASVVFTMVLGSVLLGESLSRPLAIALVGSGAGVAIVAIGGSAGEVSGIPMVSLALVLASALCWSVFAVLGRTMLSGGNAGEITVGGLIVGLVVMLPFAAFERPDPRMMSVSASDLLTLVVLGALVTAGTSLCWMYSIQRLKANEASVLCAIEPAFGLLFAWVLLQERVSLTEAIGAGAIVLSCLLVARGEAEAVEMVEPATAVVAL